MTYYKKLSIRNNIHSGGAEVVGSEVVGAEMSKPPANVDTNTN